MELEAQGWDGFHGSETVVGSLSLDGEALRQKLAPTSGGFKQEGSGFYGDDWRASKVFKLDGDFSPASTALLLQNSRSLPLKPTPTASATTAPAISAFSGANVLSFSSCSKPETLTLPNFHQMPAAHTKNTGCCSVALNASTRMYVVSGARGPFTQSQWVELEQQALIYKYITANVPVPVQLLIPIRNALQSAGLFGFNGGTPRPNAWGWGPFPLGYSNSTDPEPGRCRRTDGKKWRCSREAVADQKYCERHMNRGRNRSRKHVEARGNGHSSSGATNSSNTKCRTPTVVASSSSNGFDIAQHSHQGKSLQLSTPCPAMNPLLNRMLVSRENSGLGLLDAPKLSCSGSSFSVPKHQNSYAFGLPSSGSLLVNHEFHDQGEPKTPVSLHTFMDEWPKNQGGADRSRQYPASSPTIDNLKETHSPLRLSQELEMVLGQSTRQVSSVPISREEASMGGPLGEVLQSISSGHYSGENKKTPAHKVLGLDGMESYQLSSSSPTGILQKSALVSLSNSSVGSSPTADTSKTTESGSNLYNDHLGSD